MTKSQKKLIGRVAIGTVVLLLFNVPAPRLKNSCRGVKSEFLSFPFFLHRSKQVHLNRNFG